MVMLLVVDFFFVFVDLCVVVGVVGVEWVDIFVLWDVFELFFVVDEVVFCVCCEFEVLCE